MKYLLLVCALSIVVPLRAQDLREYIPNDAQFVGSINSNNVLDAISIAELDNSTFGNEILQKFSSDLGYSIGSFSEFGINTNANTYFYYATTDSLSYTVLLAPLKDHSFLNNYFKNDSIKTVDNGAYYAVKLAGKNCLAWDDKKMVLINGQVNYDYFQDYDYSAIEAELAEARDNPAATEDMAIDEEVTPLPADVDTSAPTTEITYEYIPYLYNYQLQLYADNYYTFCESLKEAALNNDAAALEDLEYQVEYLHELALQVDSICEPDPTNLTEYTTNKVHFAKEAAEQFEDASARERAYELITDATYSSSDFKIYKTGPGYDYYSGKDYIDRYEEQKILGERWTESVLYVAMSPAQHSILNNTQYLKQYDDKAVINVWNGQLGNLISDVYTGMYSAILGNVTNSSEQALGFGEFSSNLYFEDQETRVTVDMTLSEEVAKAYKRMGDRKINRKFFNYINEDKLLGYVTYNINSKKTLEEYPAIAAKSYSPLFGTELKAEMDLGLEVFSLILDEEAVAKLIKGDALIGFNGVSEKEVSYTTYEYDENYEYNAVEATKMEKLPDFLLMASTEEAAFTNKLIDYLVKKHLIAQENGYYRIIDEGNDIPLDLYFTLKNDIFFLSTSTAEISAIVAGTYKGKLSRKHKKIMKQGNFSAFFNGSKFGQEFPFEESLPPVGFSRYAVENASDFYLKSSKLKKNKMHSELIMEIPATHKNLIHYMLGFMDYM